MTPSQVKTAKYNILRDPDSFRPFTNAQGFAVDCKHSSLSRIPVLFFARGPSAIAWFVALIVINAVKGQAGWTLAHVAIKVHKVLNPFSAHRNTSCAIMMKIFIMRIKTSGFSSGIRYALAAFREPVNKVRHSEGEYIL